MIHHATSNVRELPSGILAEIFVCSCGSQSSAAQMAGTTGGLMYSAVFGHHPCPGIIALWEQDKDEVTIKE